MIAEFPPVLIFWLGAVLLPLLPKNVRPWAFLAFPAASLALVLSLPIGTTLTVEFLRFELHVLEVTQLSRVFGIIFSLIGIIAGIYALHVKQTGQQVAALLYGGGALCVTFAGDYLTLFAGWEVMAVASGYLVWARGTGESYAAGIRYFLVHLFGGSLLLAGIAIQVVSTGSILLRPFEYGESIAAWLIIAGVALNTALPPLHAWLADSYHRATITGAVFMSALTTKSAVYVLALLFSGWDILLYMGVMMALYGVVYAVLANDIRQLLAYHIISQVGYMVAGVGIGTTLAINGTAAHAFSHILYKALLFMGAGVVLYTTGKSKLTELGGLYKHQRLTYWLYMIGAFSISGFPLFNGFISKSIIVSAAGKSDYSVAVLLLMLASIGTFLHTGLKLPYWTWHGRDSGVVPAKAPKNMIAAMAVAAFFCVLFGVYPDLLYRQLPHAMNYQPYTLHHLVEAVQLLAFTFIAFWIYRSSLAGEPYVALDTDWFYRAPRDVARAVFVTGVNRVFDACETLAFRIPGVLSRVFTHPAQFLRTMRLPTRDFDPDADRGPLADPLALTLLVIVLVAIWNLWW
ncbi:Na(+)/H(+) antiporter subunit D [candidate division GN15 bacterium]|nr:Na(+)/H(+) antiporter subunit D [candidate division GN15 bacterium]